MASRPIAGAFSLGRTLTRSTKWCASHRNALTTSGSSTNSPGRRGGPSAPLSRTPNCASQVDHRPIVFAGAIYTLVMRRHLFVNWAAWAKLLEPHALLTPGAMHAADGVM